jgi:hypothetical protein
MRAIHPGLASHATGLRRGLLCHTFQHERGRTGRDRDDVGVVDKGWETGCLEASVVLSQTSYSAKGVIGYDD